MTSPLFEPEEDWSFNDWGVGVYEAVPPQEPDGERLTRMADAKRDGARLWREVQAEIRRHD